MDNLVYYIGIFSPFFYCIINSNCVLQLNILNDCKTNLLTQAKARKE